MSDYEKLVNEIQRFQSDYRRSEFEPFSIGPLYDLFPQLGDPAAPCEAFGDDTWANNGATGVYEILDEELLLLYVGKASLQSFLGSRLGAYFGYGSNRECKIKHSGWSRKPRYVLTIGVPVSTRWEAPSLEEYLILKLRPMDNTAGLRGEWGN